MVTGNGTHRLAVDASQAVATLVALYRQLIELHRPSQRPYDGAPGFVLTQCRVCDGNRSRVQLVGEEAYTCEVCGGTSSSQGQLPGPSPDGWACCQRGVGHP